MWYAPEFVLNMIPPSGKNVDKKVLAAIDTNRKNGLKDAPPAIHRHVHYIIVAGEKNEEKNQRIFRLRGTPLVLFILPYEIQRKSLSKNQPW